MTFKKGEIPKGAKPFKPGQSGNPNGQPRKLPKLEILLADVLGEEKNGETAAMAILKALRKKAATGDIRAAEVLLNRGYGLPKQTIDTNVTNTTPVIIDWSDGVKDTVKKATAQVTKAIKNLPFD